MQRTYANKTWLTFEASRSRGSPSVSSATWSSFLSTRFRFCPTCTCKPNWAARTINETRGIVSATGEQRQRTFRISYLAQISMVDYLDFPQRLQVTYVYGSSIASNITFHVSHFSNTTFNTGELMTLPVLQEANVDCTSTSTTARDTDFSVLSSRRQRLWPEMSPTSTDKVPDPTHPRLLAGV